MVNFDAKRLSQLDRIVVGASGVAFIGLFLPWYGVSVMGFSDSVNGWSTSYGWLGALFMIASGAYLVLYRSHADLSRVTLGPTTVVLGAAAIGTFLVVVRWITLPSGHGSAGGIVTYSYGPRIGLILTLIVGIVQVISATRLFRSSGEELPWTTGTQSSRATHDDSP